jgi:predicted DNA-binding transcriptional regulator AlpA
MSTQERAWPQPANRILTLKQWAESKSLSYSTAKRFLREGNGPRITQLGVRRIGVSEADDAAWCAARLRDAPEPQHRTVDVSATRIS